MKVIAAVAMLAMMVAIFPRARQMMEATRDAPRDWAGALVPLGIVVLVVMLLISSVRG
ncbi:MAG: hypothetical protein AB7Q97_02405 [Gammaproteobacteria bacterium]